MNDNELGTSTISNLNPSSVLIIVSTLAIGLYAINYIYNNSPLDSNGSNFELPGLIEKFSTFVLRCKDLPMIEEAKRDFLRFKNSKCIYLRIEECEVVDNQKVIGSSTITYDDLIQEDDLSTALKLYAIDESTVNGILKNLSVTPLVMLAVEKQLIPSVHQPRFVLTITRGKNSDKNEKSHSVKIHTYAYIHTPVMGQSANEKYTPLCIKTTTSNLMDIDCSDKDATIKVQYQVIQTTHRKILDCLAQF